MYTRRFPQSYFGLKTAEQFTELTTYTPYDYEEELKAAQVVIQSQPLQEKELYGILADMAKSTACPFCKQFSLLRKFEKAGGSNFVRLCCSQMAHAVLAQGITFEGRQLRVEEVNFELKKQNPHLFEEAGSQNTIELFLNLNGLFFHDFVQETFIGEGSQKYSVTAVEEAGWEDFVRDNRLDAAKEITTADERYVDKAYEVIRFRGRYFVKTVGFEPSAAPMSSARPDVAVLVVYGIERLDKLGESGILELMDHIYELFDFITEIEVEYDEGITAVDNTFDLDQFARLSDDETVRNGYLVCQIDKDRIGEAELACGEYSLEIRGVPQRSVQVELLQ